MLLPGLDIFQNAGTGCAGKKIKDFQKKIKIMSIYYKSYRFFFGLPIYTNRGVNSYMG